MKPRYWYNWITKNWEFDGYVYPITETIVLPVFPQGCLILRN